MADWYVSSAVHAAVPVFTISTGYTVGQFVRRITSTPKAQWVMRCTVAGTSAASEPTWPITNNGTVVSGGATFANVTGQSAYGWSAAAGDIPTLLGAVGTARFLGGDRLFVSSDHAETQIASIATYGSGSGAAGFAVGQVLSVNRAGSVPPVAADLLAGATATVSGSSSLIIEGNFPVYHYGVSYIYTGSGTDSIAFNSVGVRAHYFDTCQLSINSATASARILATNPANITLYNSTVRFGATSQSFRSTFLLEIVWLGTSIAVGGPTFPGTLFNPVSGTHNLSVTARGVDLSGILGTLVGHAQNGSVKCLFDSCRIASGVTRYSVAGVANSRDEVELTNCYDGAAVISERYVPAGTITTEFAITLTGGAQDNVGVYSHKMVSNTNLDKYVSPLAGFWMDVGYSTVGSSKTATVEIISSASLNNDEISLLLEYQGTTGSSLASFSSSLPSTLTTASVVTASTATWNASPASPVRQKLEIVFTPRTAGRVRAQVRLGKAGATVYYNPQVTIT